LVLAGWQSGIATCWAEEPTAGSSCCFFVVKYQRTARFVMQQRKNKTRFIKNAARLVACDGFAA
jgi:hypothetical protein